MIISDHKKFIFTHIQKTGGSTIHNSLQSFFDHRETLHERAKAFDKQGDYNIFNPRLKVRKHLKQSQIIGLDPSYEVLFNEYFVFTFVRNPYDLIYSRFLQNLYQGRLRRPPNKFPTNRTKRKIFLGMKVHKFNEYFIASGTRLQFNYILPGYTDFIGHTERLITDFQDICRILNLEEIELKSVNVRTESKPTCDPHNMKWDDYKYLDKYERRTIKLVNKRYAKDFEYFGYQKQDPKDFPMKVDRSDDSIGVRSIFRTLQRFTKILHPFK